MSLTVQRVLIVCHAFWEGLSRLPYFLHQTGCEISVFGPPENYVSRSRFVRYCHYSSSQIDVAMNELQQHLSQVSKPYDFVLIGDDPVLYALERRREEAWVKEIFPSRAGMAGIDFITSKASFIQRCQQEKIAVPDFEICQDKVALLAAANRLAYPLVIKEAQGYAGLAVSIIADQQELELYPLDIPVIAQRYVSGRLGSAAVFYKNGQLLAWFSYYRARTWGALGPSAAIEFCYFPELQGILEKLGRLSGFHGACGVDFIHDVSSGGLVVLEQNFRPTLTVGLGQHAGVDSVAALASILGNVASFPADFHQDVTVSTLLPLFPQDVFRAIEDRDWRGLLAWCTHVTWWQEMNWREFKLCLFNWRQIIRRLFSRRARPSR